MSVFEIKRSRQVCWDMALADRASGVSLQMHRPVRKGSILACNEPWEGETCGYGKMIFDGEKHRFYYRSSGLNGGAGAFGSGSHAGVCVAYSFDGKHFHKPDLGLCEYQGSKHNNLLFIEGGSNLDNFSVLLDTNPACPPDERFKAIAGHSDWANNDITLKIYTSADGLSFRYAGEMLRGRGRFDSLNNLLWDQARGLYRIYFRGLHQADPAYHLEQDKEHHVRDVRMTESPDFVNWTDPVPLDYGENDKTEFQLYTNGVMHYDRSDSNVGLPTRYDDRALDEANYKYLPDLLGLRAALIAKDEIRSGTAITDCMIMTSRDGLHFERFPEAFYTPGPECRDNWVYGDSYFAHGLIETASDFPDEPNELSLYVGKGYRSRPVSFERYTVRMDGFFSWHASFAEGEIVTVPLSLEGDVMDVNFATSVAGYLRIEILDEQGEAIDGYDSGRLFGDSVDRPVDFAKPLAELSGRTVRLRLRLCDCDLYSFRLC